MRIWASSLPLAGRLQLRCQQRAASCVPCRGLLQPGAAAPDDDGYLTLSGLGTAEVVESKSRFVAVAGPAGTVADALAFIESRRDGGARHNCWAYVVSDHEFRSTDDGEPSGTAGPPILRAIRGAQLQGVCVLVTRYFGGILLGTGGLTRCYGGAAAAALRAAPRVRVQHQAVFTVACGYGDVGAVYAALDAAQAERLDEAHQLSDEGSAAVRLRVRVALARSDALSLALASATAGRVALGQTQ